MAKLTTDDFIKKAREMHGDRFDYSKVEYIDNMTNVCIICPVHGEFWQRANNHLKGIGCPKCRLSQQRIWTREKCFEVAKKYHTKAELKKGNPSAYNKARAKGWLIDFTWYESGHMIEGEKRKKWTYETCFEEAKKYSSRSEFQHGEGSSRAYQVAREKGWLDDYIWFKQESKPSGYWTYKTCIEEAKKYSSRSSFKSGSPTGYTVAREHGWLDDYTWFAAPRKQVKPGYWTYERCYEEAKKYKTKKEFGEKSNGAKQFASKMGWIKDYIWFEKPFRWTSELCEKEARKYRTKVEFLKGNAGAYKYAYDNGLLHEFDWLEEIKKPNGYWTRERCEEEAHKYSSKGEFLKGCSAAHHAAVMNGWIDDYDWLIDQRIDIIKGKIDCVYVYIFEDMKVAYVGRTLMRRQNKRDKEHIFNLKSDNVARYAKKHHIPVPPMKILESNLTLEEGLDREDYWRKWYEQHGYTMLNRMSTGIGKGSLGGISHGKWNKKTCFEEARKYNSAHEFEDANGSAYAAALRNGWVKDYTWFVKYWEPKWNKETCYREAKKYKTRNEFQKNCRGGYRKAWEMGWLDEYDWMPSRQHKPVGYWDNYDHCSEEAKKYKNRKRFQIGCMTAYNKALKNGWLDDYTWFDEKQKHNYWNKETCFEEAKKYHSRSEFGKHAVRAYELALANGWIDDYTWLKKLTNFWTYDACKAEASKYEKRSHFKANAIGAYTKSRINGWLDEFFPPNKTTNTSNLK